MTHESVKKMWNQFIKSNDVDRESSYTSWHFCIEERDANELAELVKSGMKTATSSLHLFYEIEKERLPEVNDYSIITNFDGVAQAIIKTIHVRILPFKEVDAEFARKEGEGDRSLEYWRSVHIDFFEKELAELNKVFEEEMLVVCEEFILVHK